MTSAHTAVFAGLLFVLFCGPPTLGLWVCIRRFRHAAHTDRGGRPYLAGAVFSGAALLINGAIVVMTGVAALSDPSGHLHLAAGALSWLCLWLWIVMLVLRPRVHRGRRV